MQGTRPRQGEKSPEAGAAVIALLHCVVRAEPPSPQSGLLETAAGGLRLLYSELPDVSELPMPESALAFHRVQQEILRKDDLVPFRFPTLLAMDDVRAHLKQFAPKYDLALERVAGCVQMEIELEMRPENAGGGASGTEYLRAKALRLGALRAASEKVRSVAGDHVRDWRVREGKSGQRMYALAERAAVGTLRASWRAGEIEGVSVRVTGPWPATEFMDLEALMAAEHRP